MGSSFMGSSTAEMEHCRMYQASIATGNTQIFELPSSGHYGEYWVKQDDRAIIEKEYLTATLPIISLSWPLIGKHSPPLYVRLNLPSQLANWRTNPLEANWPARPRFSGPPLRGFRLLANWDRAGHRLKCIWQVPLTTQCAPSGPKLIPCAPLFWNTREEYFLVSISRDRTFETKYGNATGKRANFRKRKETLVRLLSGHKQRHTGYLLASLSPPPPRIMSCLLWAGPSGYITLASYWHLAAKCTNQLQRTDWSASAGLQMNV